MTTTLPLTKARKDLPTMVDNAQKKFSEYVITVHGTRAAVLISAAEYDSWKETNEIRNNPSLLRAIRQGEKDIAKDDYVTLEDLREELKIHV